MNLKLKEVIPKFRYLKFLEETDVRQRLALTPNISIFESSATQCQKISNRSVPIASAFLYLSMTYGLNSFTLSST